MKATLEFNLDDPDDARRHMQCLKGIDALLVLHGLCESLRTVIKHGVEEGHAEQAEKWRGVLQEELDDHGVDLDALLS